MLPMIRPLTPADCDAWAALLGAAFARLSDDMIALLQWLP